MKVERVRGDAGARVAASARELRKIMGLSMQQLAARMEEVGHPMGWTTIQKIENKERRVDADDLAALAEAFGVEIGDLFLTSDERRERTNYANTAAVIDVFEVLEIAGVTGDSARQAARVFIERRA